MKILWIIVSCNSVKAAQAIGQAVLKKRLAACFGIYPRIKSFYFWPPKSNRLEINQGPTLVLETLSKNFAKISTLIKKLHSDKVPFIGSIKISNVNPPFYQWLKNELK